MTEGSDGFVALTLGRSAAEIRRRWAALRPVYSGAAYVIEANVAAPYRAGALRRDFLQDGLNAINFARYLAGLPDDVVLDDRLNDLAQHGAVLLAASEFSHFSPRPIDMGRAFFRQGLRATSHSNIGSGYDDLESFNNSCMDDSDPSNIGVLGHRRWLLNPDLKRTGMGLADDSSDTYVFDTSRAEEVDYDAILWPCAGNFPAQMFASSTAWSVTVNPDEYALHEGSLSVTLRRLRDGRSWTFTRADHDWTGDFFEVSTVGCGVSNCIIFWPDPDSVGRYRPGDVFEVRLSRGVLSADGKVPVVIAYQTRFMSQ